VALRLEESAGVPLSSLQADSLLDEVAVYGDDGDFFFDPVTDPFLASAPAAGLDKNGVLWIVLPDNIALAHIPALGLKTFFVVLDLAQPPGPLAPKTVRVTALTDGPTVCRAEDRAHDLPLVLEWAENVSTATLCAGAVDVVLTEQTVTTTVSYWACDTLTARDHFVVGAGGDVTLEAANRVVLGSGFSVVVGGELTVGAGLLP
jgi:hypothetical protein